ncbi:MULTISPECIES: hypothetical protein [unclassified Frankia]|uniref:hypothetical protein n=1 Tax=unclassified Frankia TaxID=2632575 RepID=UPI0006EBF578|nr:MULTISPECIES: hypothetical protein [unclassified Frankia]
MFTFLRSWWALYLAKLGQPPDDPEQDRGSTTENVIWIAFFAALALAVIGIFGPQILDAARSVVFK